MNSEFLPQTSEDALSRVREWLAHFKTDVPLIMVPVFEAFDETLECLESLFEHTPPEVPILLIDDASTDSRLTRHFEPLSFKERFGYFRKASNKGFVDSVNLGFELAAGDVVIINSDVVVPPRWLERLRAAAYSGSTVATATPLTNHGGIISVPYRNQPTGELPHGFSLETIDRKIEESSLLLRPALPAAVGHCIYFKRLALDLLGGFDTVFAPGYGEEVDFSQRAILMGLLNVLADDLFVYHKGSRSFNNEEARQRLRDSHDAILEKRYPWFLASVGEAMSENDAPLGRALERARTAVLGYKIAIDATCLSSTYNGTRVATLGLIKALVQVKDTRKDDLTTLTLFIRDDAIGSCPPEIEELVDEVVTISELKKRVQPTFDLAHRPFQIYSLEDLELLQHIASRFIITHLDSLAYTVPNYASNPDWWFKLRHFTRLTFSAADGIIFISEEARKEIARQDLEITEDRSCVTYVGVDSNPITSIPRPPVIVATSQLMPKKFILMVGTNFHHKNRLFALRLFEEILNLYGWDGKLVLAGSNNLEGGSAAEEANEISQRPQLQSEILNLSVVDHSEKQWLLENAALLLYPSTVEGFGMVPFETAWANTPTLTARISALAEVLGDKVSYLESFEPTEAAQIVWKMLSQPDLAEQQIAAIRQRGTDFSWEKVAGKTWDFYRQILGRAPRISKALSHQLVQLSELESEHRKLQEWSAELNYRLITVEKKRWLGRFKRFLKLNR